MTLSGKLKKKRNHKFIVNLTFFKYITAITKPIKYTNTHTRTHTHIHVLIYMQDKYHIPTLCRQHKNKYTVTCPVPIYSLLCMFINYTWSTLIM